MNFHEIVEQDITDVFLNFDEFGSMHNISGKDMLVMLDDNDLQYRNDRNGVQLGNYMFYAHASDFEKRPEAGDRLMLDGQSMFVADCKEDMGVYTITLTQNY